MKLDQMYQALCELAEKLDIEVREHNFRTSGIKVASGLCRLKGKLVFIMDKHKTVKRKVKLLAAELARQPIDDIYIVPLVREFLVKYRPAEDENPGGDREVDQAAQAVAPEP